MCAVNSSNARGGAAGTVTDLRTGSTEVRWPGTWRFLLFRTRRRAAVGAVFADPLGVAVQGGLPEAVQPVLERAETGLVEPVHVAGAEFGIADQAAVPQHRQVLGDRRAAHG